MTRTIAWACKIRSSTCTSPAGWGGGGGAHQQILHGVLAGGNVLGDEAQERQHGKTPVLHLLQLVRVVLRAVAQAQGVEGAASCNPTAPLPLT